jgi:hypothetical protein
MEYAVAKFGGITEVFVPNTSKRSPMPRTCYTATVQNGKFVLDNPNTDLPEGTILTLHVFGPKEREQFVQQNADRERCGVTLLTWDEFVDDEIRASQQRA